MQRAVIDFLKEHVELEDVIEYYSPLVEWDRVGKLRRCSCPLPGHQGLDSTPSFYLYPDHFYCYACEVGGDVFKFILVMESGDPGFGFRDALTKVEQLAQDFGVGTEVDLRRLEEEELEHVEAEVRETWTQYMEQHGLEVGSMGKRAKSQITNDRTINTMKDKNTDSDSDGRLRPARQDLDEKVGDEAASTEDGEELERSLKQYATALRRSSAAKAYLKKRGITLETAERIGVGWSKAAHGIVFPVRNQEGKAVGYQVRIVERDERNQEGKVVGYHVRIVERDEIE